MRGYVAEPYKELTNAIIQQAAIDYRNALVGIGYERRSPEYVIKECEEFFRSDYYSLLTKVPGEYLIERIRKEVQNESHSNSANT